MRKERRRTVKKDSQEGQLMEHQAKRLFQLEEEIRVNENVLADSIPE